MDSRLRRAEAEVDRATVVVARDRWAEHWHKGYAKEQRAKERAALTLAESELCRLLGEYRDLIAKSEGDEDG